MAKKGQFTTSKAYMKLFKKILRFSQIRQPIEKLQKFNYIDVRAYAELQMIAHFDQIIPDMAY